MGRFGGTGVRTIRGYGGTEVRGYEISSHASFQRKVYSRTSVPPYLRTPDNFQLII